MSVTTADRGPGVLAGLDASLWAEDCHRFHHRVLTGSGAHWCAYWDYMPIDASCVLEMELCKCPLPSRGRRTMRRAKGGQDA